VSSFIEIRPLSAEISRHVKCINRKRTTYGRKESGLKTDGRPDGRPGNMMPAIVGRGIKLLSSQIKHLFDFITQTKVYYRHSTSGNNLHNIVLFTITALFCWKKLCFAIYICEIWHQSTSHIVYLNALKWTNNHFWAFMAPPAIGSGGITSLSRPSVRPLTPISCAEISLYLVEGFQ